MREVLRQKETSSRNLLNSLRLASRLRELPCRQVFIVDALRRCYSQDTRRTPECQRRRSSSDASHIRLMLAYR